ncbi:MAG: CPBP family intramembrane glutamic endopeptidase [Halohasta sp.]
MRRRVQWLLWNPTERRLRTPWRLLAGTVVLTLATITALVALQTVGAAVGLTALLAGFASITRSLAVSGFLGVVVALVLLGIAVTVDRRRPSDYGLRIDREWLFDCGVGLLIGAGAMTAVVLVGVAGGWLVIEGVRVSAAGLSLLAGLLVVFLIVGIYEELLIRGYLLTNLAEGFGWFEHIGPRSAAAVATLVSSVAFGGFHAVNPNATLVSTAVISVAGVMLALGYLFTGELAIPIGIHITWNVFQGLVYGLPVSGATLPVSVVDTTIRGPTVVSGGEFGPEAGLLGMGGIALAALGIAVYCRERDGTLAIDPAVTRPDLRNSPPIADQPVEQTGE